MGLATLLLVAIPVALIILLVIAFMVAKKVLKIVSWVLIVVIMIATIVVIYNDVIDFDQRNTLFFYDDGSELVSAWIGNEDAKTPVDDLSAFVNTYENDPESLYANHHKVVIITQPAFNDLEELELQTGMVDRTGIVNGLNSGDAHTFVRSYEETTEFKWFVRNVKAGYITVEPETLAFRLAKIVPYSFVGGAPE